MPRTRFVPVGLSYPYDIKRFQQSSSITTILDAGANIGQTSLFLRGHFPGATIFCI
ncbi:hypothetical protein K9N68_14790 [Kovacikia minuta CCNUW1]|uniref:hypothetical protein n=1 Tax=Kovacikia minuta TaxID=2931930 RepID=UPI001CCD0C38|nr:hypothetical protein [Kovacikia minuta]UBF28988.1 hypothetical protein K9N68_14790 [Kovacikia minuta CCNUW1]